MPESEVLLRNKDRESVTKLLNQKNHELEDVTFTVKEIEKNKKKSKISKNSGDCKNQQQKQRAQKRKSPNNLVPPFSKIPRHFYQKNNCYRSQLPQKPSLTTNCVPSKTTSYQQSVSTLTNHSSEALLPNQQKHYPYCQTKYNTVTPMHNKNQGNPQNDTITNLSPIFNPQQQKRTARKRKSQNYYEQHYVLRPRKNLKIFYF